jgi:hypothetical protein
MEPLIRAYTIGKSLVVTDTGRHAEQDKDSSVSFAVFHSVRRRTVENPNLHNQSIRNCLAAIAVDDFQCFRWVWNGHSKRKRHFKYYFRSDGNVHEDASSIAVSFIGALTDRNFFPDALRIEVDDERD